MRDPFSWSVPLGRWFGITVRVHILFLFVVAGVLLRVAFQKEKPYPEGAFADAALLMGILLVSVLLHEFGHCAGARLVDGDAHEILIWPLGGLAAVEVPHRPRAHFIAVAAGPAVNLALCVGAGFALAGYGLRPPWNPFDWSPLRPSPAVLAQLHAWGGEVRDFTTLWPEALLARVFWVNWTLFLLNVVLPGFPLDGGRMLQAALWPWYGFRQATLFAIFAGFCTMIVVAVAGMVMNEVLPLLLAAFIYLTCRQQWIILETGGEDSLFGYDFSQGYTSLEGDAPPPRRRPPGFWQRWRQKRALRKRQREQDLREAEERRMDELLDKVHREGLSALTDEERRFLKRVSEQKRHH